jgi:ribosomal protein S19
MSKSKWKPVFIHNNFIEAKNSNLKNNDIILFNRSTILTEEMLGKNLHIYNGIRFFSITVESNMLNHKVGEFSATRKKPIHKNKKKS